MIGRFEVLDHHPGCTGSWTVRLHTNFLDDDVVKVEVFCWSCEQRHVFTPLDGNDYEPARDWPKRLGRSFHGHSLLLAGLTATLPPVKVARGVWMHPERCLNGRVDSVYEWIVADDDGNVLGYVGRQVTVGYTDRSYYQWGTLDAAAGHGGRCQSPDAAARACARAATHRLAPVMAVSL